MKTLYKDGKPVTLNGQVLQVNAEGGADLSLGLTNAAVGQIAKISAVDENGKPTAWAPVDMPSGGGGVEKNLELLKDITTEENVTFLNLDLGKECSEVCVFVYGRWATTASAYVVINMCSNDSYSETGQQNTVYETNRFYSNNDRAVAVNLSTLSPGYWKAIGTNDIVASTGSKVSNAAAQLGLNYTGALPHSCRYLHIGTHDSTSQYKAGLRVRIWGK